MNGGEKVIATIAKAVFPSGSIDVLAKLLIEKGMSTREQLGSLSMTTSAIAALRFDASFDHLLSRLKKGGGL
jgi:hypothetical protein